MLPAPVMLVSMQSLEHACCWVWCATHHRGRSSGWVCQSWWCEVCAKSKRGTGVTEQSGYGRGEKERKVVCKARVLYLLFQRPQRPQPHATHRNLYTYDAMPQEPLARDALCLQGAHRSSAIRECAGAVLWAEEIGSSANMADCQAAPLIRGSEEPGTTRGDRRPCYLLA
jgi:hypothetical protein